MNSENDPIRSHRVRLFAAAVLVVTGLGVSDGAAAQEEAAGSALAAAAGGVAGLVAGGYGNVALVVMKARYGNYPHTFGDAFGWESIPILTGVGTGVGIGLLDSELLLPWIIGGAAGFAAGAGVGYVYSQLVWGDPESRWSNGAVMAAVGMTIGSTFVLVTGWDGPDPFDFGSDAALRLPLVQLSF